jgi:arylsulfatase A-like enzyme
MKRREFLKAMGIGICAAASGGLLPVGASDDTKPNIILCMADDQGWGDMAYCGHPVLKTPTFDEMAAAGLRFDQFYSAAPVCSPTRGSVMTGRTPNRYGCFSWGHPIRPQEVTIAESLKGAGYVTGHFGKWHLGSVCKGSPVNPGACGFDEWVSAPNFFDNDPILSRQGVAEQMKGESSMVTVDVALEFIRKHAKGPKPMLAVVWFGSPHVPHIAAEEDRKLYEGQDDRHQNYYGEITGMDRAMGKLRRELKSLGIRDNTILWYCSDNGGVANVSATGGREQKGSIYEGGLRVPAILEWPARLPKHRMTNMPCCTSDIYPTLLEIAGARPAKQPPLDGISLMPMFEGKTEERSKPVGFWQYPQRGVGTPTAQWMSELLELQKSGKEETDPARLRPDAGNIEKKYPTDTYPGHAAWLDWPWKLHRIQDEAGAVKYELYNLAEDPQEERDLASQQPDRVKSMKPPLEAWEASVTRSLNGEDYT